MAGDNVAVDGGVFRIERSTPTIGLAPTPAWPLSSPLRKQRRHRRAEMLGDSVDAARMLPPFGDEFLAMGVWPQPVSGRRKAAAERLDVRGVCIVAFRLQTDQARDFSNKTHSLVAQQDGGRAAPR